MMKEKYLVSVDLDSTFLRDDKSISDSSIKFVQNFVQQGNYFIINTGRPHQGTVNFLDILKINQPIIVNNGGAIVWYSQDLQTIDKFVEFSMDIDIVKQFNKEVKNYLNTALVTSLYTLYSYSFNLCPWWVIHRRKDIQMVEGDISQTLITPPIRSEYYVKHEFKNDFENILFNKYSSYFDVIYWGFFDNIDSYEVSSKQGNKGYPIEFLAKILGVSMKNTFAFGDQLNDLSMLEKVHDGVAMINARDEVKSLSHHITSEDNNHDGVIHYLENYFKE